MRAGSHSFVIFFFLAIWHHLYFVTDPLQFCLNLSPTQNYPYNFWNKYELGDDFTLIDLLKIWNWSNRLTLFSTLVLKGRAFNHQMGEWGQGSLKGLKLFHRVTFRHKNLSLYIYIYIYIERERERERTSLLVLTGQESMCQCRRHRFDPWSRKIPRAVEHLTLCTPTTESVSRTEARSP